MQIFFSYGHDKHSKVVKALKEEIEKQTYFQEQYFKSEIRM